MSWQMRWKDSVSQYYFKCQLQPLAAADFTAVAKSGESAAMQSGGRPLTGQTDPGGFGSVPAFFCHSHLSIWGRHHSVTSNFPSDTGEGWATDSLGLGISYLLHLLTQ